MPIFTPNYGLACFLDGDIFSAAEDKARFIRQSNQLAAVSRFIGDGIISGWEIVPDAFPSVKITKGSGLIDGFYVSTENDFVFDNIIPDSTYYFFAKRALNVVGNHGKPSSLLYISIDDITPPAIPSDFIAVSQIDNINLPSNDMIIDLSWTQNTETDFSHIVLSRSTDNIIFTFVDNILTNTYSDINIFENTTYFYRISSVDKSGNESGYSFASVSTPVSSVLPLNPKNFSVYPSDENVSLVWDSPDIDLGNLNSYLIIYSLLKSDGSISETETISVSNQTLSKKITGLQNGKNYEFKISTVDDKGRISEGLSKIVTPNNDPAPPDPDYISVNESGSDSGPNSVILDINWVPGGDEYESTTKTNYRAYLVINGVQDTKESLPIETAIDQTFLKVSVVPFIGQNVAVPENTLITLRITCVSLDGHESNGTYYRFKTGIYTGTQTLRNVLTEYDINTIKVSWNNNPDTYRIKIKVERKLTDDEYQELQFISEETTDRIWMFFISKPSLGYTYYISLTPYNKNGIEGSTTVVSQKTYSETEIDFPSVPADLDYSLSYNSVELRWKKPDNDALITGYNIYRAQKEYSILFSDYSLIDSVSVSYNSFIDYGLIEEESYSYYITSMDIFGRESKHLSDDYSNIGIISFDVPVYSGVLESVLNPSIEISGFSAILSWEIIHGDSFDAFEILRSINNLHDFESIATIDYLITQSDYSYTDTNAITESNINYYYIIRKISNDTSFVYQTSRIKPDNSIYIGSATLSDSSFVEFNGSGRRDIALINDTLDEYTLNLLLYHLHRGIGFFETQTISGTKYIFSKTDASEIDFNPSLIVTDWSTTDGSTFYTNEDISGGSVYIVKVNGFFPKSLYSIDEVNGKIFFADPLLIYNTNTNTLEGTANIELTVLGIEETTGVLQDFRLGELNAQQIGFSRLVNSQLPKLDHEGRIDEDLIPVNTALQRYDNNTFFYDGTNKSNLFSDGTTFFSITDKASEISVIENFDETTVGSIQTFQSPNYSEDTKDNIIDSFSGVSLEESFTGSNSYKVTFKYVDDDPGRWVRLTTYEFNPIIDLNKRISLRMMVQSGSFYLGIGIRKSYVNSQVIGSNGGIIFDNGQEATIEFVGVTNLIESSPDYPSVVTPQGKYLVTAQPGVWQTFDFDLLKENIIAYTGNSTLNTPNGYATLEHLNFTTTSNTEDVVLYIDELVQITDTLAAGTSQGIQKSSDYGISWTPVRYTETPIHKFYKAEHNPYIWGISSKKVYLSTNVDLWYEVSGINTVQVLRDICEDNDGNMFVSSDKGIYVLKISDFASFSEFVQTQIINAFSTETYAVWNENNIIYASTEIGIYSTIDYGENWTDELLLNEPVPLYGTIKTDYGIFAFSKRSVFRKLNSDSLFFELSNLQEQISDIEEIWDMEIFNGFIYLSTNNGIYINTTANIYDSGVSALEFDRVFSITDKNNLPLIAYSLDNIGDEIFVGSENILYSSNDLNEIKVKREYINKEKPTFRVNNVVKKTGFTYSSFNGVISFRDSFTPDITVSADNLPRNIFYTENKGWAQANIQSPIIINKNGEPIWIDFALNEKSVTDFVSLAKTAIQTAVPLLSYKNSNVSDDLTNRTIASADTVLSGNVVYDSNGTILSTTPIINYKTVNEFLSNYSYFVFNINKKQVNTVFPTPVFIISGQSTENRSNTTIDSYDKITIDDLGYNINLSPVINYTDFKNSFDSGYLESELLGRAKEFNLSYTSIEWQAIQTVLNILNNNKTTISINVQEEIENRKGFSAQDASGITIDPYSGKIDFSSLSTSTSVEDRNRFKFEKEDYLTIDLIGAQIGDVGNITHNDIENDIELVNSGMSYNLSANVHGNIIKTGLFFERQYPGIFKSRDVSNIKSVYNTAYTSDWYDKLNSTIDYNLISETENTNQCNIVYCINWFGNEDPYFSYKLWLGTDHSIFEYSIDYLGNMSFERTISPSGSDAKIRSIVFYNNEVYTIANEDIYVSSDYGLTWNIFDTENLSDNLYKIVFCNNNLVVGTDDGTWWNTDNYDGFNRSSLTYSSLLSSSEKTSAEQAFVSSVFNLETNNFVFLESKRNFFVSQAGSDFIALGPLNLNNVSVVNRLYSYKNLLWVATDKGLYSDAGTMFSEKVAFSLQTIKPTGYESVIPVNDITATVQELNTEHEALYVGGDDGIIYRFKLGMWKAYQTSLPTIHKMFLIEDFIENYIVATGYNNIIVVADSVFDPISDDKDISIIEACKD